LLDTVLRGDINLSFSDDVTVFFPQAFVHYNGVTCLNVEQQYNHGPVLSSLHGKLSRVRIEAEELSRYFLFSLGHDDYYQDKMNTLIIL
jgi:hypothetical protein